jgi:hypothetical protein
MGPEILKQLLARLAKFTMMQRALALCLISAFLLSFSFWKHHRPEGHKPQEQVLQQQVKASPKGFELFDSGTWIKGEKELQMLEMRALKGQLESEIEKFENIKNASVILDFGHTRTFGAIQNKPKASVILSLIPGASLSPSTLMAITSHLVGGVRGLESRDVAISDTAGRIYQTIGLDPACEKLIFEERLRADLDRLLSKIVGVGHFHMTLAGNQMGILLDQERVPISHLKEITKAIHHVVNKEMQLTIDRIPFEKEEGQVPVQKEKTPVPQVFYLSPILLLTLLPLFWRKKGKKKSDHDLFNMIRKIDVDKLADTIKKEEPHTIALLLSYLEPIKASHIIATLPITVQEQVYAHLSEMEVGDE